MGLLEEKIQEFLMQARIINTHAEFLSMLVNLEENPVYDDMIEDLCEQHKAWLYDTYQPSTVHGYIRDYRNDIQLAQLSPGFLVYMKEREDGVTQWRGHTQKRIDHRHEHQYPITPDQATAFVDTAIKLLDSPRYADVVVALCVLTGRRPYEIAVRGRFRPHREAIVHANQYLYYRGLAKTREDERTHHVHEIPVLINPHIICAAHKRLSQMSNFLDFHPRYFPTGTKGASKAFMSKYGGRFREQCTKYFHPLVPDMDQYLGHAVNAQSLRKFYECFVEGWWDYTGWATPRFIAEILGHYDERHAGSYLDVCFSEQVPKRFMALHRVRKEGRNAA